MSAEVIWAFWNALPENHPAPVHAIANQLGLSLAEVAAVVYPAETFGEWSDADEEA